MATVYVNDQPVDIGNDRLNCIQAAERAGVFIPHYCWHPALSVVASCRMCLVEVGDKKPDGTIAMQPKVVPGCQTPCRDGTIIVTGEYDKRASEHAALPYPANYGKPGDRAKRAQADTLEGLLLNHPLDCPVCDKAGECKLQDFSYDYGRSESRMVDVKRTPPNKPEISSKITLFTDRCIMCTRCVRFTREISGSAELTVINRGDHAEIDVFPGEPLENKLSGNVVDLCPVGALGSKDFLYKQRVWFLKEHASVCPNCATGCSIDIDANKDVVYRVRPRENLQAQGYFICDEGRWGYHYVNAQERFKRPAFRQDGTLNPTTWSETIDAIKAKLGEAVQAGPVAVVVSPFMTVEEAYLAVIYFQGLGKTTFAVGPTPMVGQDDHYPKDRRGKPIEPVKFTIRAEKAPNRRGVETVLKQIAKSVVPLEELLNSAERYRAIWVTAGYPRGTGYALDHSPYTAEQAAKLARTALLIAQDILPSPLTDVARLVLPSAAWSEKEGTFVNHSGLAQAITRGNHSPGEARSEGQVFADLLGRPGLFRAVSVHEEIGRAVPAFANLPVPAKSPSVKLELPMLNGQAH